VFEKGEEVLSGQGIEDEAASDACTEREEVSFAQSLGGGVVAGQDRGEEAVGVEVDAA